jgi:hypothetical protein
MSWMKHCEDFHRLSFVSSRAWVNHDRHSVSLEVMTHPTKHGVRILVIHSINTISIANV